MSTVHDPNDPTDRYHPGSHPPPTHAPGPPAPDGPHTRRDEEPRPVLEGGCLARIEMPCGERFDESLGFFTEGLGMRLVTIFPADAPAVADLDAPGLALRLRRGAGGPPPGVILVCERPADVAARLRARGIACTPEADGFECTAPNGAPLRVEPPQPAVPLPPLRAAFSLTQPDDAAGWHAGRAGMSYRDLIPTRLGGRFVASHIRVDADGPVPDYVHYHRIRFQMIYCLRGAVRLVYEDQGEPFTMRAGDCVLQPPTIRHRVLASEGLEVVEVGCPAEHPTHVDHDMTLPTGRHAPGRDYGGQRYALHRAADNHWQASDDGRLSARDFGFAEATHGLARAGVVRLQDDAPFVFGHDGEFLMLFLARGRARLLAPRDRALEPGACIVPRPGEPLHLRRDGDRAEFLVVRLEAGTGLERDLLRA